jgi:hypothetical protein
MSKRSRLAKITFVVALWAALMIAGTPRSFAACETIDANAQGTSTQMGRTISIKVTICAYSTPEDKQVLKDAFLKGQSQGLADALQKMKSVGRIAIPGTVGYDLSYIDSTPTDTGRIIRFVANRRIAFGEAYNNSQSMAYNLTAGRFILNDKAKGKSTGDLYPAAQLIINKQGQLQWELRRNPWKLVGIIDWQNGEKGDK